MSRKQAFRVGRARTGLGLFATEPIKRRGFIVNYKGRKLTTEQADILEARGNRYLYEINSRWTIDGTTRRNLGRYANHSCTERRVGLDRPQGGLRAIKNIKPGDEITYDYGRDYYLNVITTRGCKCDKCREKRAAARAKARAKARRAKARAAKTRARARAKARLNGQHVPAKCSPTDLLPRRVPCPGLEFGMSVSGHDFRCAAATGSLPAAQPPLQTRPRKA